MTTSVLILGAGGHSKVLIDCLQTETNILIHGILEINPNLFHQNVLGINVIGHENEILSHYPPSTNKLVNGIGSITIPIQRENVFTKFKKVGYDFLNVIHHTAYIGKEVLLGEGAQLMAGCIIQPGSRIGDNVIINTRASIDHDCNIASHVHIAPGVVCSGGVTIGKGTHIGSGAVLLQGIKIGEHCLIASGAVVVKDVVSGSKVKGVPAKGME